MTPLHRTTDLAEFWMAHFIFNAAKKDSGMKFWQHFVLTKESFLLT
jgi:hypothetical protein